MPNHAATQSTGPLTGLSRLGGRLRKALPQGGSLPEEVWRQRHRALLILLWAHAVGLVVFGAARGYGVLHSAADGLAVAVFAVLAMLFSNRHRAASVLVSLGLITSSAVLIHVWGGVIEAHFHFFVIVVLLTLYEDWLPFSLAAGYVVLHHGIMGALAPGSVYNHPDAIAHPWRWAFIHGAFVTAAGAGAVIAWRLNEDVRTETREAYRKASESEQRFKSAFENAPIGMVLLSLEAGDVGCFLQVNRAMIDMAGRTEERLLALSLQDIARPDERASVVALLQGLVESGETTAHAEHRFLRADDSEFDGGVSVSLVTDASGRAVHAIAQLQDISERKRARELLEYQAFHDVLTELPNRRRLMEDLERAIASATTDDPVLLVLFDLDGFKSYNDTFGHPAGDALLSRLGNALHTAVEERARAYRMGGDEFCVLGGLVMDADPLALTAAAALSTHGDGFSVTASYGSVVLPVDASTPAEALRKADERLYASKGAGRASAGRQTTDALLRALSERNADLGMHLFDVTDLVSAVADELAISSDQVPSLLQAAALHDVGKLSIPDAILDKPGPLDDQEWAFIHSHTEIGERILSAAPALAKAAKIVRSTHERFDGGGYPDGLAGEDIPLGSRVIAVCDAYDAMTASRPYRPEMSPEGALSELRRNSGTQFDPGVVTAFEAVLARERTGSTA